VACGQAQRMVPQSRTEITVACSVVMAMGLEKNTWNQGAVYAGQSDSVCVCVCVWLCRVEK